MQFIWYFIIAIVILLGVAIFVLYKNTFYPAKTGEIIFDKNPNVKIFAIKENSVNFFILKKANTVIVVDSGYGKHTLEEFEKLHISPTDVSAVFLTHSDRDHVGGLPFLPDAEVFLPKNEVPMIDGRVDRFKGIEKNSLNNRSYNTLEDGIVVQSGDFSVKIIDTPGHTVGSACYLIDGLYLFTGDNLRLKNDKIIPFVRGINMDTDRQIISLNDLAEKTAELPIKIVCTAHTGYSTNYSNLIQKYIKNTT
ncbi:MAG: MBL fold metallo-hydrolase [Promethearchaeota archaeon]